MAKVLIVDDEKMICEAFKSVLEEDGHEADCVFNAMEALEKIKETAYDLVFLDVLMPRMEGREAFEKIKQIREVPVAIMSGYIPPNKEQEILASGAVACLKKPLDLAQVKSVLASVTA